MERFPENLDVWVLAGQSNMEGRGLLAEALPPDGRVWSFSMAGREIAVEPVVRKKILSEWGSGVDQNWNALAFDKMKPARPRI